MYKIGELIIYGNEGVCEVEAIGGLNISGSNKKKDYYTLKPINDNGKIFAPTDTSVFTRKIINYDKVQELIEFIPSIKEKECNEKNSRLLESYYKQFLQTHECIDLLTVITSISDKEANAIKSGKKLGQIDDKFMKAAKGLIDDEFSVVLGIPKNEVQTYINDKIEENKTKIK